MENIKPMEQQENKLVEAFDAVPREEMIAKITALYTPEEQKTLTKTDLALIMGVARRNLEAMRSQTIDDALIAGTIARTEAVRTLGKPLNVYAEDKEGSVVATGENAVEAMKKAQEMTQ